MLLLYHFYVIYYIICGLLFIYSYYIIFYFHYFKNLFMSSITVIMIIATVMKMGLITSLLMPVISMVKMVFIKKKE